jgi:hypothetical protein
MISNELLDYYAEQFLKEKPAMTFNQYLEYKMNKERCKWELRRERRRLV